MDRFAEKVGYALGLVLAVGLVGLVVWLIWALLQADKVVQSGVLTAIGALAAVLISQHFSQRREIEARHFEQKAKAYENLIGLFFKYFAADATKSRSPNTGQTIKALLDFKKAMTVWASDEVIKEWNAFEATLDQDLDIAERLMAWDKLLRAFRKDLGKDDSELDDGELALIVLKPSERQKLKSTGDRSTSKST